jgi:pyruvate dehydrogenase E1 component beta subunit
LRHSLTLPDPVIFIEHKALYARKEEADLSAPHAPWGKAVVRQHGQHVTLVTYSRMVHVALGAAKKLALDGVGVEVIDLRTLNPLDMETVVASVNRTGRAVALSEGCLTAGVAAELAARITEECFDYLEDPVVRIAAEDIPIPVSPILESASIPTEDLIVAVIKRMIS